MARLKFSVFRTAISATSRKAFDMVIEVTISEQSAKLLDQLATFGIYGIDRDEVAARLIDSGLQEFVPQPQFAIPTLPSSDTAKP